MSIISVSHLRCNRLNNPLGYNLGAKPCLSWVISAPNGAKIVTRLLVSARADFGEIIFDSGERGDINHICYPLDIFLQPRTRYFWRVMIASEDGESACEQAWFETAKLDEPWQAQWITPDFPEDYHPVLSKGFTLPENAVRARAYVCGLGIYELRVNDAECAKEYLSPGLCAYDKWLPYQSYDVTEALNKGGNRLDVLLGNGWYKGRYGLVRETEFHYGEEFALILELRVLCADGTEVVVGSDDSWSATRGSVVSSGIFDGEVRDDTIDTAQSYPVKYAEPCKARLEARRSPPTRVMHELKPVEIIKTPAGEIVLDMGQNMTGWLAFNCDIPKGATVHLQYGEILQNGNFYRDNLRTALCEYKYTGDGTRKTVRPMFTFYGFRYVKLTEWHQDIKDIDINDFTGHVLYSDMERTGSIKTANAKVNKLFDNVLWGQRGNFLDVPTDCPQRDERMGWTGDAQVFFGTAAYNMDVYAFFNKFLYDLKLEQEACGGTVPVVIPKHDVEQTGACAWGDAAVIIPWGMYVRYGNKHILEQQFESMKAWVEYIGSQDKKTGDTRLWRGDFHYADWLSLDNEDPIGNRFGGTDPVYLASCYYRYSAMLVSKAAAALGNEADAERYRKLSEEVRSAIIKEYFTVAGKPAVNTQTAYTLALMFDIVPPEWREQTAYALRRKLKESNYHLRTGFIGTSFLCRVLSETGSNDIAYKLLLQEDFPSWLYQVNMGATTIWERWNSVLPDGSISDTGMNSLNHYSYGSIMEWMYRNAAGINPLEQFPGFRRFKLAPQPDKSLGSLEAVFNSPSGEIRSAWKYLDDGDIELVFTVPYGTTAELTLPDASVRELCSGTHSFVCKAIKGHRINLETPISEMLVIPEVTETLYHELPKLTGMMLFPMLAGEMSLNDFIRERYIELSEFEAEQLCEKLTKACENS